MKKRMNIIFFGLCFLASILAEAYCFQVLKGELISTIGIGLVVMITGYLFMDAARALIRTKLENLRSYSDRILKEETDRWSERYTEIVNLQKATYTATKKNTANINEQFNKVLSLLETQENNHINQLHTLIDLQKKSMEGQKNALNMQIQYNKKNTNQITEAIHEEKINPEILSHLTIIHELLGVNNDLLKNCTSRIEELKLNAYIPTDSNTIMYEMESESEGQKNLNEDYEVEDYDYKENDFINQNSTTLNEDNELSSDKNVMEDSIENTNSDGLYMEEDSYKEDEIAKDQLQEDNEVHNELNLISQDDLEDLLLRDETRHNMDEDDVQSDELTSDNYHDTPANSTENIPQIELPYDNTELQEINEEPGFNAFYSGEQENITVKPLYDDPNKALTADEIAALFAAAGR